MARCPRKRIALTPSIDAQDTATALLNRLPARKVAEHLQQQLANPSLSPQQRVDSESQALFTVSHASDRKLTLLPCPLLTVALAKQRAAAEVKRSTAAVVSAKVQGLLDIFATMVSSSSIADLRRGLANPPHSSCRCKLGRAREDAGRFLPLLPYWRVPRILAGCCISALCCKLAISLSPHDSPGGEAGRSVSSARGLLSALDLATLARHPLHLVVCISVLPSAALVWVYARRLLLPVAVSHGI